MTYYLDFDRTLFDTDSFKEYLAERAELAPLHALPEPELARELNRQALANELTFAAGELSRFLYPDAADFIRAHPENAVVVTFGNPALQRLKVENVLRGLPPIPTFYTGDTRKGDFLTTCTDLDPDSVLVDDAPIELEILTATCPGIRGFEMRRDGGAGDGRWPVVRSLTELP
jgi:hypothetical protein